MSDRIESAQLDRQPWFEQAAEAGRVKRAIVTGIRRFGPHRAFAVGCALPVVLISTFLYVGALWAAFRLHRITAAQGLSLAAPFFIASVGLSYLALRAITENRRRALLLTIPTTLVLGVIVVAFMVIADFLEGHQSSGSGIGGGDPTMPRKSRRTPDGSTDRVGYF